MAGQRLNVDDEVSLTNEDAAPLLAVGAIARTADKTKARPTKKG